MTLSTSMSKYAHGGLAQSVHGATRALVFIELEIS